MKSYKNPLKFWKHFQHNVISTTICLRVQECVWRSQGNMRGVEEKNTTSWDLLWYLCKTGPVSHYLFPLPPFRSSSPDLFLSTVNYWETSILAWSKYFPEFLISFFSSSPVFSHPLSWITTMSLIAH